MYLSNFELSKVFQNNVVASIDLCIKNKSKVLLGKRKNPPAKGYFFVPGGRIQKNETIKKALNRILFSETGQNLINESMSDLHFLGIYEHFYKENFLGNNDFNSHYLVLAYLIDFEKLSSINLDKIEIQHSEYIWYDLKNNDNHKVKIHKYSESYLNDISINFFN